MSTNLLTQKKMKGHCRRSILFSRHCEKRTAKEIQVRRERGKREVGARFWHCHEYSLVYGAVFPFAKIRKGFLRFPQNSFWQVEIFCWGRGMFWKQPVGQDKSQRRRGITSYTKKNGKSCGDATRVQRPLFPKKRFDKKIMGNSVYNMLQ